MRVIENDILPFGGFKAMTLLCWILVRMGTVLKASDITHEEIHWEQEKELLIVGFYLLYFLMFCYEAVRCLIDDNRGRSEKSYRNGLFRRAYRNIAFEREAYGHEDDMLYRWNRKHFAWMKA